MILLTTVRCNTCSEVVVPVETKPHIYLHAHTCRDDQTRHVTVRVVDPAAPRGVRRLVQWVFDRVRSLS